MRNNPWLEPYCTIEPDAVPVCPFCHQNMAWPERNSYEYANCDCYLLNFQNTTIGAPVSFVSLTIAYSITITLDFFTSPHQCDPFLRVNRKRYPEGSTGEWYNTIHNVTLPQMNIFDIDMMMRKIKLYEVFS